ncbi:mcb [Symbiodinium pilosum]|uniref:Mcb protein n=1 Tax=Symbiodinium pilosum TaxID=2952 RepID=A0A812UE04_SYMPI|nr:mcb [Symbiodinium pilosum]
MSSYGAGKAILAHGSLLTFCWMAGALSTGAYGIDSMTRRDLAKTLKRIWTAGAVAAVLLAGCTSLFFFLTEPAETYVTAFDAARKFQKSFFDLFLDVELGAACITTWRLYYAGYI